MASRTKFHCSAKVCIAYFPNTDELKTHEKDCLSLLKQTVRKLEKRLRQKEGEEKKHLTIATNFESHIFCCKADMCDDRFLDICELNMHERNCKYILIEKREHLEKLLAS
ncbi:MAG: hypothetical protein Edafosvirus5_45 [Edafosvirus sp.]|uniref:C2H2-type domain-containing protein n=1 Tax=Edafosvirus sp. TaxID=2487765 RepID=A0A3G4ZTC1_9VIRU|nr:MAG: hypothetical protein Edafosvirus5_45 [Edafosvirus sp.]